MNECQGEPIQVEKHEPLFDKCFRLPGLYVIQLKSGLRACVIKRSEIWKDKTACYWVTFELGGWDRDFSHGEILCSATEEEQTKLEVRYNELSAIWEA